MGISVHFLQYLGGDIGSTKQDKYYMGKQKWIWENKGNVGDKIEGYVLVKAPKDPHPLLKSVQNFSRFFLLHTFEGGHPPPLKKFAKFKEYQSGGEGGG